MPIRRYEMTEEQWKQICDLFPTAKTGRPPKENTLIFNAILWMAEVVLHSVIYQNVMVLGKQYTAVSVSSERMEQFSQFFMLSMQMQTMKI